MSIWEYANPLKFMGWTAPLVPVLSVLAALALAVGLIWGYFYTPDDYRMGASVKIIYVHVPSAMMAINAWAMMLVASLIWIVRRHHVSALAARAAAPVGMIMTVIALITGAIWGQPMWGTWWAWDPRLTSFLILFLFYLGYMAMWAAIENPDTAADLTSRSLPCRVGLCDSVALCGEFLESGAASGRIVVSRCRRERGGCLLGAVGGFAGRVCPAFPGIGSGQNPDRDPRPAAACDCAAREDGLMPDLGKYAAEVLSAYALSLAPDRRARSGDLAARAPRKACVGAGRGTAGEWLGYRP